MLTHSADKLVVGFEVLGHLGVELLSELDELDELVVRQRRLVEQRLEEVEAVLLEFSSAHSISPFWLLTSELYQKPRNLLTALDEDKPR